MFILNSEIEIKASSETVYNIIADVANYNEWNPFNRSPESTPVHEGKLITIDAALGHKTMRVKHRILAMEPNTLFKWCDVGFFTYFAYGERTRFLSTTETGTLYRVELKVTGILSSLAKKQFGQKISAGMDAEKLALKKRAENFNEAKPEIESDK